MNKLPKPNHKLGYPKSQLESIIEDLGITKSKFYKAFGINTCAISETGETIVYPCDVERTLWKLGHGFGRFHVWD